VTLWETDDSYIFAKTLAFQLFIYYSVSPVVTVDSI